jgi:hypothetical protein
LKNNKNAKLVIVIAAFILALLAGGFGGYFVYDKILKDNGAVSDINNNDDENVNNDDVASNDNNNSDDVININNNGNEKTNLEDFKRIVPVSATGENHVTTDIKYYFADDDMFPDDDNLVIYVYIFDSNKNYITKLEGDVYSVDLLCSENKKHYYIAAASCGQGSGDWIYYDTIYNEKFELVYAVSEGTRWEDWIDWRYFSVTNDGDFIIAEDKVFTIYSNTGNLIKTSKKYSEVFGATYDYIIVLDTDNHIKLIDKSEKIIADIMNANETKWHARLHYSSIGYSENKYDICVIIFDPYTYLETRKGIEFYYDSKTNAAITLNLDDFHTHDGGLTTPSLSDRNL